MRINQAWSIVFTALLAGTLGYWGGRSSSGKSSAYAEGRERWSGTEKAGTGAHGTQVPELAAPVWPLGTAVRGLLGDTPIPDNAMGAAVMRVLEEPDAVRRTAAVTLLLDSMNPVNADAFRRAFLETTAKSGRRNDNEWGLMLRQYGKVLGVEAMQRLKDVPQDAQKAMEGWAIRDPAAARAWLSPGHPDYGSLRKTMLSGIALANPAMAFRMILEEPGEPMDSGWIIHAGILSSGTDGVTAALQESLDHTAPEAVDTPAFKRLFDDLAGAVFRQKWEARESVKMMPWLESLKGQPFVTPDMIGHGAMDSILQGNLTDTLNWLDRMEVPGGEPAVAGRLLQGLLGNTDLLARADAAALDRVIARFPPDSRAFSQMATAMEQRNPSHAARLRALAPAVP